MKALYRKRLLKLADFLDALPREKFDFGVITRVDGKPMREALKAAHERCGTVGCAIGWMPVVFPQLVMWDDDHGVVLKSDPWVLDFECAKEVFNLTDYESGRLFMPLASGLGRDATPKQVARHIRKFVRAKEKETAERVA
jgi:hypothetical protein